MSGMIPEQIILAPIISERSVMGKEMNKYSFRVAKTANKVEIKKAVEHLFKVKVGSVNTQNYMGRTRRVGFHKGKTPDWKKAIVTLREGQKIAFFESM